MTEEINITPNKVIPDPNVRGTLGNVLYMVAVLAGLAALFVGFFPEYDPNETIVRIVAFVNAAVSMIAGAFGLIVTRPNIPKTNA